MNAPTFVRLIPVFMAVTVTGCAKNNASIELARICTHPTPGPGCEYPASCDLGDLINQYVDLGPDRSPGIAGAYLWTPVQVNNQLPNNKDASSGHLNTNDAFIEEFRIHYQAGIALPDVTFRIGPQVVSAAGSSVLLVPVVPTAIGDALRGSVTTDWTEVMAIVKARGRLADETTFETGEYKIPVEVCNGCLATYSSITCPTAGDVYLCCVQYGQSSNCACVTP